MNLKFWKKDSALPPMPEAPSPDGESPDLLAPTPGGLDLPPPSGHDPFAAAPPPAPDPFASPPPAPDPFAAPPAPTRNLNDAPQQGVGMVPADHAHEKSELHSELILARLDAIKTQLDVLNQRITNVETKLTQPGQQQPRGPWYTK